MNVADLCKVLRAADRIARFIVPVLTPRQKALLRRLAPALSAMHDLIVRLASGKCPPLTEREGEVALLLCRDKSTYCIAKIFGRSHPTIEKHRQNLYRKLGISNRTELLIWFLVQCGRKPAALLLGALGQCVEAVVPTACC